MIIVKMNQTHIEEVAHLEQVCFHDPWSLRAIEGEVTNPLSLWFVALENDKVIGYVGSQAVLDQADMMNIAVDPQFRRMGVAEKLIQKLQRELYERNVTGLLLEVRMSNLPAQELYKKMGFVQVGKRPGYYRNPKEDALILRKELEA